MNMSRIKHPSILIDLGHVGKNGLPYKSEAWFQKEMDLCREWGFQIEIANDRISLTYDQDQLVPDWIQKETPAIAWDWLRVHGFLSVESTNSVALEMARQGAPNGTLIYAEEQTAGKGRRDRIWFSPARTGLYSSLLLRPAQEKKFWPLLTHVASVALGETLKDLSRHVIISQPLEIDIKWPNDVLLSGKKCAGILLETVLTEGENPAAIVGVGVNVHPGSVPDFLKTEAACIDEMAKAFVPRRLLLVQFLRHFQLYYMMFERGQHADLLERWKGLSSMWNGARVLITDGNLSRQAETCGLNEMGALLVRTADGKQETLLAGDVSVCRDIAPNS
jgi:BirA family transcriptional regulator, biotin operon repressor / biotin---[acetyl-CoA-carboxylase] ligase